MSDNKAWVYLLAREVPDVMGQGMSLSSIVLGGEWVNGSHQLYPAFATEFDAMAFKRSVDGALACEVLALQVALDVPEADVENDVPEDNTVSFGDIEDAED
jgi:hypothetical protein